MKAIAYRAQQVTIDAIKPDTTPMISLLIQKLELEDGEITGITAHTDRIYRNAKKILTETVTVSDPVTGLTGEISIAGVDQIIRLFANRWTAQELGCSIDPTTGWAVDCEG